MSKRITGALFCVVSSILFSARYISAAIHISEMLSWDEKIFMQSLSYVGPELLIASIVSLIVGVAYLVSAELDERKMQRE